MPAQSDIAVCFRGVRGSIACPGPDWQRYGGNTSCVEVRCGPHLLIFDAGTGLRPLGKALAAAGAPVEANLFFGHTHLDHLVGLPFFKPIFDPATRLRLWAGHLLPRYRLEEVVRMTLTAPLFPDLMDRVGTAIECLDFRVGDQLTPLPGLRIQTGRLNHPGGATGYRVEWAGKSIAYITDTEHRVGSLDPTVLALVDRVDLMIYDANYSDEEYALHVGWGHSTWQEAIRIADQAAVRTLALFHHDPSHTDIVLDEIGRAAERLRPGTIVAREGLVVTF